MKKHLIYLSICLLAVANLQAAEAKESKKETKKPGMEREAEKPSHRKESAMEKPSHTKESAMEKPSHPAHYEREADRE